MIKAFEGNWPVTYEFGKPISYGIHQGVDWGTPVGTELVAPMSGKVTNLRSTFSWIANLYHEGNFINIQHNDGSISFLCHLTDVVVKVGDYVKEGQLLGRTGATGNWCWGAHLHWGYMVNGEYVNVLSYLNNSKIKYMETFREALIRLYWDYLNRGASNKEIAERIKNYDDTQESIVIIRKEFNSSKERKARLFDLYKAYKKRYPKKFKKLPKFDDWYKFQIDHATPFYRIYQAMFV